MTMALSVLLFFFGTALAAATAPAERQLRGRRTTTITTTTTTTARRGRRTTSTTTTTTLRGRRTTTATTTEAGATCADTDRGAADVEGYVCADYSSFPSYCVQNGAYDDEDFTLVDMCCACGASGGAAGAGGDQCTDTDRGSTDAGGYGCSDYAQFPSYCVYNGAYDDEDFTLVDMCCACGGAGSGDAPAGGDANCADTDRGATDADGYSCADYSAYPSQCIQNGAYDDEDFTLVDMCCACGASGGAAGAGGDQCTDTDRGSTDAGGYGCSDYAQFPSYCVYNGAYDDEDFTLVDMCCACGAGSGSGDVPAGGDANCADTDRGATDADGYSCADYSAYPSQCTQNGAYDDEDFTLVDMCCACGAGSGSGSGDTPAGGDANCADTDRGATDADGYSCADYSAYPSQCAQSGAYDDEDFTLVDMCCACGGAGSDDAPAGGDANCADTNRGATDADGYSCADYSAYPSQCAQNGAYDDEDFTLVDMCCACGASGGAAKAAASFKSRAAGAANQSSPHQRFR